VGAITQSAFGSLTTALSTELNSLANGAYTAASGAISNSAGSLYGGFRLGVTFGTAPSAGGWVGVYLLTQYDGSNYADGGASPSIPQPELLVASFTLRSVTTAQLLDSPRVAVPPGSWKLVAFNGSGQAFPASGATVKYTLWSETVA